MKILALDSSGLVASVALMEDDNLIAEYTVQYKKTHSQTLLPMLEEIARMVELELSTVDAIAVAAGPGSFTGLRIGSATAKGLAFALNKPIVPVPTVDGLAYQMYGARALVCPIMDARRSQVYTGIYEFIPVSNESKSCLHDPDEYRDAGLESRQLAAGGLTSADGGKEICPHRPDGCHEGQYRYDMNVIKEQCAVAFDEIAADLNQIGREVLFLGDGVPVFRERMAQALQVPYTLAPPHRARQSAAAVAALGSLYYAQGRVESGACHAPVYLRLSQAERERAGKEQGEAL